MQSTFRWDVPPEARRLFTLAVAAVLTPFGYFSYLLVVRSLQRYPYNIEPLLSTDMLVYFLVLGLTGGIAVLGWSGGLRVAPIIAVGGLLIWPWFPGISPIGNVAYIAIPFVCVLFATAIEAGLRFPDQLRQFSATSVGRIALAVGLLHFIGGFGLQMYSRSLFWMDFSPFSLLLMGLVYIISGLGLAATGTLAIILWKRNQLVTPAAVTVGWFGWGVYGTWTMRDSLPWGAFQGINWFNFTPYPDYMLKWTALVVAVLLLAGIELTMHRVGHLLRKLGDAPTE